MIESQNEGWINWKEIPRLGLDFSSRPDNWQARRFRSTVIHSLASDCQFWQLKDLMVEF